MNKRKVILIVNTSNDRREELHHEFNQSFQVLESQLFSNAYMLLCESYMSIAVLFMEISDNALLDDPLLKKITSFAQSKYIPVFFYLKDTSEEALSKAYSLRADNVFPFDLDLYYISRCVRSTYEVYRSKWEIDLLLSEQKAQAIETADSIMNVLSNIVELRNAETGYHTSRIRNLTYVILNEVAEECPEYELTPEKIMLISRASILHDIGKISIPDSILNKPAALTSPERQTIKTHTVIGGSLIKKFSHVLDSAYLHYAYNIAVYHHERFDGGGYPEGLIGDDIPICAQVVGLADAFDALTNERPYKEAIPMDRAANMILNGECGVFSPKLLECFKNVLPTLANTPADNTLIDGDLPDSIFSLEVQKNKNALSDAQIINRVLMHYSGATIIEIMPKEQVWHVLYNADPILSFIGESSSFEDLTEKLERNVIASQDYPRFFDFIKTRLPQFVKEGEYRISDSFKTAFGINYELTLMSSSTRDRDRLLMFCRPQRQNEVVNVTEKTDCKLCSSLAYPITCRANSRFDVVDGEKQLISLMGYDEKEGDDLFSHSLIEMIHSDDIDSFVGGFEEQLSKSNDLYLIFRLKAKRGEPIWIVFHGIIGSEGYESYLFGLIMNLDTIRKSATESDIRLEQYRNILSQNRIVAFEYNLEEDRVIYSKAYEEIFGYEPLKSGIDETFTEKSHFHPTDIPQFYNALNALKRGDEHQLIDVRISTIDGEYLWCRMRSTGYYDTVGKLQKVFGIITIIEEEKKRLELLQQQTELDSLTGSLFNGSAAKKKIGDYLKNHAEPNCSLVIIDLDDFKNINDTYGHLFGDSVLIEVGRILKSQLRSHDIIARIGGDEFMVMMKNVSDKDFLIKRYSTIINKISNMYSEQFPELKIGCSIGIASSPEHGTTYENLFRCADTALYKAKKTGKNTCVVYSHSLDALFTPNDITIIDSEISPRNNLGGTEGILPNLFDLFYTSENIESTIKTTMSIIGKEMNVSRVYVFENSEDDKYCSNTFEWCNEGIDPQIDVLQKVSYEDDIPGYLDNFNEDGVFFCGDIYELETGAKEILIPQGIKSMLQCCLMDKGHIWGYVGFDECKTSRIWPKEQIELLAYFSKIVSVFLRKHRTEQKKDQ